MKNALLGFTVLGLVVGSGSAGVFFAHRMFTGGAGPAAVAEETAAPRDLTPRPIALAPAQEMSQTITSNPYVPQPMPVRQASADEIPDASQLNLATESAPQSLPPEEPDSTTDAPETTAPSANPFGARRAPTEEPRYAERPAVAEMPSGDDQGLSDEPAPATYPDQRERSADEPTRRRFDRFDQQQAAEPADQDPQATAEEQPAADSAADGDDRSVDGTGRPGDPHLSGSQAPTLTIEKVAPPEIQIGKPAKFLIKVRNVGSVPASGVEIHDTIPQGTQLLDTAPQATRGPQASLVWSLGTLKPGDEQKVELELMPTAEGEIGSVATVQFRAEASVRTLATRPMLAVEVAAPAKVMKGDRVVLKIKLSNPGSGAASGVIISENVPQGLSHPGGDELEFEVGVLKPGESRELELVLGAAEAGVLTNTITARGEANVQAEASAELEVVAPQLHVSMTGPKRRYLERNATHNISITNPGTASAKDVDLVAVLPRELKFVEANNGGQFDAASHSVYWSLEELPPQETGTVTLTTLPIEAGDAKLLIRGKALQGLSDEREEVVTVEGLAAINFQLSDVNDPIEVGERTSYEVRVTNQGSKAASNVRVVAMLPREMKAVESDGASRYKIEGQRIVFAPLKQLAPKADASFTFKAQAAEPGDLRVQVQITSDEIRDPVTKEESTRVYGDE